MKLKNVLFVAIGIFILSLVFTGCAKAEKETEDPANSGGVITPAAEFNWTPGGTSEVVANDSYYIPAYNNIVATKNSNSSYVDITLDNLNIGAHTISPSAGITLEYSTGSATYTAKSGVVNITDKTGTLLSGNFTAALVGGTLTTINGEFNNIPQK